MAKELGISRQACYLNLKKFGVNVGAFRTGIAGHGNGMHQKERQGAKQDQRQEAQQERQQEAQQEPRSLECKILEMLSANPLGRRVISRRLGQKKISGQLNKVIQELLAAGKIERTIPNKPQSSLQKYRLGRGAVAF